MRYLPDGIRCRLAYLGGVLIIGGSFIGKGAGVEDLAVEASFGLIALLRLHKFWKCRICKGIEPVPWQSAERKQILLTEDRRSYIFDLVRERHGRGLGQRVCSCIIGIIII
jgi:hypothetical protein